MTERTILNVHLRGAQTDDAVVGALSRALGLPREHIRDLAADDVDGAAVLLERGVANTKRARAFRTTISAYVDPTQGVALGDDLALARVLARELLVDALAPRPDDDDPYLWILVKPDGRTFVVSQTLDEGDEADDVVVNDAPAALKPWAAP
jgi:hypothetical protein